MDSGKKKKVRNQRVGGKSRENVKRKCKEKNVFFVLSLFTWLASESAFEKLRSKLDPAISDGKVKGKKHVPNEDAKRQPDPKDSTSVGQLFSSEFKAS